MRIPEINTYFSFIDYDKAFECVDYKKICGKFLKRYQTILPASWETCMQVKKQQLELGIEQQTGSKLGKEYCIFLPCLFNLYAENIMQNAGLDEAQAEIKIARRNINNLRYRDDTTLMAEIKEELRTKELRRT